MVHSVAIYLCDRAYGGPEEGGWYYDCGIPSTEPEHAQHARTFHDEDDAHDYARTLNETLEDEWNQDRPDLNSVLSVGRYYAEAHNGDPAPYPTKRPFYS